MDTEYYIEDNKIHYYKDCPKIKSIDKIVGSREYITSFFDYNICKKCDNKLQKHFIDGITSMITMLCAISIFPISDGGKTHLREDAQLWVEPCQGARAYQMPFYQALRVVRKHDWRLSNVAPKRPLKARIRVMVSRYLLNREYH